MAGELTGISAYRLAGGETPPLVNAMRNQLQSIDIIGI
jgi:hypothetical protein